MSGPKKFVLLLAHSTKGNFDTQISLIDLEKNWNKMKGILGKYNPAYSLRAKESDWAASLKVGAYSLRPDWKKIFN